MERFLCIEDEWVNGGGGYKMFKWKELANTLFVSHRYEKS
jgi:hypothetical protein